MEGVSKSINEFAWEIFQEMNRANKDSNILYCPLSLAASLSLLLLGSQADTKSQIAKVLHISDQGDASTSLGTLQPGSTQSGDDCEQRAFDSDNVAAPPDVHNQLKALFIKLTSSSDVELEIANGLFTQINFPIKKDYLTSAQALYQANLKSVDFEEDVTREDINTWVESQTNGKIKNLFAPNSLDKNTSLILVNATYLKGKWTKMFKKENTKNAPFYVKKDKKITVPMMSQTDTFHHAIIEELDAQIIEMPYANGVFSMFICLPNQMYGLQKVIEKLTLETMMKCTNPKNLSKTKLEACIPCFKIEESYDLSSHLKNMGMVDAFSLKANLSRISSVGLHLSKVIHKAFIEVNEEGTEAAAATGAVLVPKSLLLPHQFKADHPFLCFIKNNETDTILFCLKCSSPSS